MTPKEKKDELIEKWHKQKLDFIYVENNDAFIGNENMTYKSAVKCAIIEVDEIIKVNPFFHVGNSTIKFWKEVKQQLENEL